MNRVVSNYVLHIRVNRSMNVSTIHPVVEKGGKYIGYRALM